MQDKVKLPKEVAEAVSHFFTTANGIDYPVQAIMKVAMEYERYISDPDQCEVIKEYAKSYDNLKNLMSALVNGYEVEQTPEDKVRSYYSRLLESRNEVMNPNMACEYNVQMHTVRDVLNLLDINIPGVNT